MFWHQYRDENSPAYRGRPPLLPGILAVSAEIVAQGAARGMTGQHVRSCTASPAPPSRTELEYLRTADWLRCPTARHKCSAIRSHTRLRLGHVQ
jgi:hypothetical protein